MLTVAGEQPVEQVLAPVDAATALRALEEDAVLEPPPHPPLPQHGDPALRLLRRVGQRAPDEPRRLPRAGRLRGAAAGLSSSGPRACCARSRTRSCSAAAARRSRPASSGTPSRASPPARTTSICNADESEPGTFKDRAVIEGDPFSLIEAMTIAGYATNCAHGYVYLRGEYPDAHRVLGAAIEEARRRGFLGDDVLGEGFAFDLEIRKGGGAYICGEETAIFNSIEGERGEPRNKPPFPVVAGLFGKPTVVNNVETLVNVLPVVLASGPGFAETGTEASTGTKLFCLSGHVERPGVYEVPFGATLRELLELAGGVRGRARAADRAAGRRRRRLRAAGRARPAADLRGRAGGEDHARLGRHPGDGRDRRPAAHADAHRRLLPQRVVRPVRPLPRRHGAPAGGARAAARRAARAAASTRSSA